MVLNTQCQSPHSTESERFQLWVCSKDRREITLNNPRDMGFDDIANKKRTETRQLLGCSHQQTYQPLVILLAINSNPIRPGSNNQRSKFARTGIREQIGEDFGHCSVLLGVVIIN